MNALISADGVYRYTLNREWQGAGLGCVVWIMLNPSTADATQDDPTNRRCIGFSKRWGYDRLTVVNLFALRSTDPANLAKHHDPVGPDNDVQIYNAAAAGDFVMGAWGAHKMAESRGRAVQGFVRQPILCLGKTAAGHPRHPLYVPSGTLPEAL